MNSDQMIDISQKVLTILFHQIGFGDSRMALAHESVRADQLLFQIGEVVLNSINDLFVHDFAPLTPKSVEWVMAFRQKSCGFLVVTNQKGFIPFFAPHKPRFTIGSEKENLAFDQI